MTYYNENDPKAAAWLRELMTDGLIPAGIVDDRSITEVTANDLDGFEQCHFFAGIGFWALALRWAGWADSRLVWTGSCPCQPWSCAGAGGGADDERHLWPIWRDLIRACRPAVVFGEQVASAAVVGKVGKRDAKPAVPVWLDGVFNDLEAARYTCGAVIVPAASVGAPHIRQRVYWVADAGGGGRCAGGASASGRESGGAQFEHRGESSRLSDAEQHGGRTNEPGRGPDQRAAFGRGGENVRPPLPPSGGQRADGTAPGATGHADQLQQAGGPCNPTGGDQQRDRQSGPGLRRKVEAGGSVLRGAGWPCDMHNAGSQGRERGELPERTRERAAGSAMPWSDHRIHRYLDGKDRRIPIEPGLFPLADDRHPWHRGRVGLLRGAGNGIVPALAAEFIAAYEEATQ